MNILFAATSDYLPYAIVTMLSVLDKIPKDTSVHFHFLYADIVKPISDKDRKKLFETAQYTVSKHNAMISFYDVHDKMHLFDGQNIGIWGKEVSLTHYMYLLAPLVLDLNQVIYLDTDMIVNTDLSELNNIKLNDKLLAMASPSGKEIHPDMSNSGFLILNLKRWREKNTLNQLLEFGRSIEKCWLCDQNLLYQYFTKNHPNDVYLIEKTFNIFAHLEPELEINEIKVFHYAALKEKPWQSLNSKCRASYLWWEYARQTPFYEKFLYNIWQKKYIMRYTNEITDFKNEILKNNRDRDKILYKLLYKISFGKKRQEYKKLYKNS